MIKYNVVTRKVGDLIPYDKNPRSMKAKVFKELTESLDKFGLAELPVVNTDNIIIGGNHRIKSLLETHGADYEIDVLVPEKKMSEKDVYELSVRLNLHKGEFDQGLLKSNPDYNPNDLLSWGFEHFQLGLQNQPIFVPGAVDIPKPKTFTPPGKEEPATNKETEKETVTTKQQDFSSQKATQAQESTFTFEIQLKKSVRDRLYEVVRDIKSSEGVDTTPEAIEKLIAFYEINHTK